ncbi:MAG: methyltransferase domain-containing protein [Nannocystaceae bacterium]|nr:methyltransferase domain-containing protein [Nannocystaceae bacterium]
MTDAPSPLATPLPWNLVAEGYAQDVMPLFEVFARDALVRLGGAQGRTLADVACGPGTLALLAARQGATVRAIDFSPPMIALLRARAQAESLTVAAEVGDGMALPWADASVDAAASMFGLMFFPDRDRGLRELLRVLRPGGRAVVTSWVPAARIPLLETLFRLLGELSGAPASPPRVLPLTTAADCAREMSAAGFVDVEVAEVSASDRAPTTAALVESMVRSNAPVALLRERSGAAWPAMQQRLYDGLEAAFGPGPHTLTMIANVATGTRA